MEDEFSIDSLEELNALPLPLPKGGVHTPKHKVLQKEPFVLGPIPLSWLHKAYKSGGGGAVTLGLHLWYLKGLNKGSQIFSFNVRGLKSPQSLASRRRGLVSLIKAGLVRKLASGPGRKLQVEIMSPTVDSF